MGYQISKIQHIKIEDFVNKFESGEFKYAFEDPDNVYIRTKIKEYNVENKKIAVTFYENDEKIIRVEEALKGYKRKDSETIYIISGIHRSEALRRIYAEVIKKNEDITICDIPLQIITNATNNDLRGVQMSTNENTDPHTTLERMRLAALMKKEFLADPENAQIKGTIAKKKKLHEFLTRNLKFSLKYIQKLIEINKLPECVIDLIERKNLTVESANLLRQKVELLKKLLGEEVTENDYIKYCRELYEINSLDEVDAIEDEEPSFVILPKQIRQFFDPLISIAENSISTKEKKKATLETSGEIKEAEEAEDTEDIEDIEDIENTEDIEDTVDLLNIKKDLEQLFILIQRIPLDEMDLSNPFHKNKAYHLLGKLPQYLATLSILLKKEEVLDLLYLLNPLFSFTLGKIESDLNERLDQNPKDLSGFSASIKSFNTYLRNFETAVSAKTNIPLAHPPEAETKETATVPVALPF
jgi:hypothetical protein